MGTPWWEPLKGSLYEVILKHFGQDGGSTWNGKKMEFHGAIVWWY